MQVSRRPLYATVVVLLLSLVLTACGGGTSTAGVGGSGIGGTGITRVAGNVAQVVSTAPAEPTLFARLLELVSTPASAQSGQLSGIRVSGGGRSTLTDGAGRFSLENVTPSDNFVLIFTPPSGQTASLPIGTVPSGAQVQVRNVVLNTSQGSASVGEIEVEDDDSDDDSRDGDDNSNDDDGDSTDDDSNDDESTDDDAEDDDNSGGN